MFLINSSWLWLLVALVVPAQLRHPTRVTAPGLFSIVFPASPEAAAPTPLPVKGGGKAVMLYYYQLDLPATAHANLSYIAGSAPVRPIKLAEDAALLDRKYDAFFHTDGRIRYARPCPLPADLPQGGSGEAFEWADDKGNTIYARIFVNSKVLVTALVGGDSQTHSEQDANKFFGSIKML